MRRTQIYLTEEEHDKLDKLAAQSGKTKSWLIREAVEEYVVRKESAFDKEAFLKAVNDIAGMWKDRSDEEIKQLRQGAGRELNCTLCTWSP